jgi:two-component system OmpR family sensor kinase
VGEVNSSIRKSVNPSMPWFRSFYWRVALGLFAFLALTLVAEVALFLWMSDRISGSLPARQPARAARIIASDLGAALAANPQLDLEDYIDEQYENVLQTFVVLMDDNRVVTNDDGIPSGELDLLLQDMRRRPLPPGLRSPDGGRRGPPPPGRGSGARRDMAPIIVNGSPVGRVALMTSRPPIMRVLRRYGPTLAIVASVVLVGGTLIIALMVFGPARRRLRDVQEATTRLGGGDLAARAPEYGGDEIAALGRSFNRMADELASRARALDASDRARRQLLADVSHELMTPLTAMRGYVETLAMSEARFDGPTRERYLRIALEETHRLEHIIGDLLDLARLEGGGGTLRRETVDIGTLFARVAARHERELRERRVTMERQVHPDADTLLADPARLEQALQNLAANALRHTPDGGRISLTAAPQAQAIVITVRDSGPGIAPEHLPLIFDRFYKADASRPFAGGSGLGLSIVKAIVERHGGTVTARNDGGAVFEVVLPRGH